MPNRFWVRNEVRRKNPDGMTSIYCSKCGREILRSPHPTIGTITKCQLCVLKEQGVINAEDYVLPQYKIPMNGLPIPVDIDETAAAGVLLLHPEEKLNENSVLPPEGVMATLRNSLFRAVGFAISKPLEPGQAVKLATEKRSGLFGPQKSRR